MKGMASCKLKVSLAMINLMIEFLMPQGFPYFVQELSDIVVAEGKAGAFNCTVSNFDQEQYEIEWYSLEDVNDITNRNRRLTRKWNSAQTWNADTRTISSTLTFASASRDDVGMYFCEVRSIITPGQSDVFNFTSASLIMSPDVLERLNCSKSSGEDNIIHLFKSGDAVSMSCWMERNTAIDQYWDVLHSPSTLGKIDNPLSDNSKLKWAFVTCGCQRTTYFMMLSLKT